MGRLTVAFALLISLFISISSARAAQDSTVIEDNAPIRLEPKSNSKIVEYVPVGTEIRISSFPLEGGWYKTRSKTGVYGWIHEKYVSVLKEEEKKKPKYELVEGPKPERDRKWFLRGFGGFDFFRPEDLNDVFLFKDLNTGSMFGAEFGHFISERVAIVFRSEALLKDIVAKENSSAVTYNMALRSYPTMLGFDFYLTKDPSLRFSLGVFAGPALSTSFATEALNLDAPNTVVLDSTPFTTLARVNVTRPLGRIISVFAEAGYRFLKTEEVDTTNAANGGLIYLREGVFKARTIDLSGLTLALGLGLHF